MTAPLKPSRPRYPGHIAAARRNEPTPASCPFTPEEIAQFNAQHDRLYGFLNGHYTRWNYHIPILHGPPNLDKNLPIRDRDKLVWEHHNRATGLTP